MINIIFIEKLSYFFSQVSKKMSKIFSEMIFKYGYVHCDPHPGNILVNKMKKGETTLTLLDHGLYQVKIAFFLF